MHNTACLISFLMMLEKKSSETRTYFCSLVENIFIKLLCILEISLMKEEWVIVLHLWVSKEISFFMKETNCPIFSPCGIPGKDWIILSKKNYLILAFRSLWFIQFPMTSYSDKMIKEIWVHLLHLTSVHYNIVFLLLKKMMSHMGLYSSVSKPEDYLLSDYS